MSTQQYVLSQAPAPPADLSNMRLRYITATQYSQEWNSTMHTHSCAELFFITGGHGYIHTQQERFPVAVNDLIVINTNVLHTETSGAASPLEYIVLGVEGLETLTGIEGYALLHLCTEREELMSYLRLMLRELQERRPGCGLVCQNLLEIIVMRLLRREDISLSAAPTALKSSRECDIVRRYIDNHFKENLNLDQLAALVHINKYYLVHAFKREYGVSPINYLISRRILESKYLLDDTNHSLAQISHMLGFSSPSYFSQSFRRTEGVSPLEYRRGQRNGEER